MKTLKIFNQISQLQKGEFHLFFCDWTDNICMEQIIDQDGFDFTLPKRTQLFWLNPRFNQLPITEEIARLYPNIKIEDYIPEKHFGNDYQLFWFKRVDNQGGIFFSRSKDNLSVLKIFHSEAAYKVNSEKYKYSTSVQNFFAPKPTFDEWRQNVAVLKEFWSKQVDLSKPLIGRFYHQLKEENFQLEEILIKNNRFGEPTLFLRILDKDKIKRLIPLTNFVLDNCYLPIQLKAKQPEQLALF